MSDLSAVRTVTCIEDLDFALPFVGRDVEIERLMDIHQNSYHQWTSGSLSDSLKKRSITVIPGASGTGKTRFSREALAIECHKLQDQRDLTPFQKCLKSAYDRNLILKVSLDQGVTADELENPECSAVARILYELFKYIPGFKEAYGGKNTSAQAFAEVLLPYRINISELVKFLEGLITTEETHEMIFIDFDETNAIFENLSDTGMKLRDGRKMSFGLRYMKTVMAAICATTFRKSRILLATTYTGTMAKELTDSVALSAETENAIYLSPLGLNEYKEALQIFLDGKTVLTDQLQFAF